MEENGIRWGNQGESVQDVQIVSNTWFDKCSTMTICIWNHEFDLQGRVVVVVHRWVSTLCHQITFLAFQLLWTCLGWVHPSWRSLRGKLGTSFYMTRFWDINKQDAAHEPECSHVEHFCETSYLNSLHFSPVTVPVHCRLWNAEEGGVQSVECRV